MRKGLKLVFAFVLFLLLPLSVLGRQREVHFFYSETCPHCRAEKRFLKDLKKEYPDLEIRMYPVSRSETQEKLKIFYRRYEVDPRKKGLVPTTFVGDHCFVGFDSASDTGERIKKAVEGTLKEKQTCKQDGRTARLPLVGEIDVSRYSLPALTLLMGLLDGFNVCSLGALVLILGLVLNLRSREKIFIYGGLFVLITSLVYGFLIVLWYKLFSFLSPYLRAMEIAIGGLGILGGIHFLRQFIKFRKKGPACESEGKKVGTRFLNGVREAISDEETKPLALAGSILLFAAVLTVVEFPCSAAVPVVYAGILAEADLPSLVYLFYISCFVLLYMLDELIVFSVAVWRMSVWMTSPGFVTWITLVESIILFGLAGFYLLGV